MSKVKPKQGASAAETGRPAAPAAKHMTVKWKRKNWMKEKYRKIKLPPKEKDKAKAPLMAPPVEAQQFSANWKTLQEVLNANQTEKKEPVTSRPHQPQNGTMKKKELKESSFKNISKDSGCPSKTGTGKKDVADKPAPSGAVPKNSHVKLKVAAVSETKQSAATKRKNESVKSSTEQTAKKKKEGEKAAHEEKKLTEEDLWFDDVDPDDIEATLGVEAADIMRKKQGIVKSNDTDSALVKEKAFRGITKAVAIDCEMVGVGPDGEDSILARVSLVNQFGKCIYDKYVKPTEKVTDYRTAVSGIRPNDIKDGEDIKTVQREVAEILQGRIVVGHAIRNDLKILLLDHPKKNIRDTQKYKPFQITVKRGRPSLKVLCKEILHVKVQQGEHSSVQDAQATMRLYTLVKKHWEADIKASLKNKDSSKKSERKPKIPKNKDEKLRG